MTNNYEQNDSITSADPDICNKLLSRLNKAQGQLSGVMKMITEGKDCQETVYQLAAVSKAINNSTILLIAANLEKCIAEGGPDQKENADKLKKLFLTLA